MVELLVVLAILAALTVVAVQSLGPVADQARYDATVRTLTGIRDAVLTLSPNSAAGFLVDVGRPPLTTSELMVAVNAHDGSTFPKWNGPYLVSPVGSGVIDPTPKDAWGNAIYIATDSTSLLVSSMGATTNSVSAPIVASLPLASMRASSLVVNFNTSGAASTISGLTVSLAYPVPTSPGVLSCSPTGLTITGGIGTASYDRFNTTYSSIWPNADSTSALYLTDPLWAGGKVLSATVTLSDTTTTSSIQLPITLRPGQNTFNVVVQ